MPPKSANGTATEEPPAVLPAAARQGRGTRLSFLGGRKKDAPPLQPQMNGDAAPHHHHHHPQQQLQSTNGDGGGESGKRTRSRSRSKENANRRSFFRGNEKASLNGQTNGHDSSGAGTDWVTDSGPRESSDLSVLEKERGRGGGGGGSGAVDNNAVKIGSVRKRLSLLKLGKKSSKGNGLMGAVDEE